jgi:hypothetical protein
VIDERAGMPSWWIAAMLGIAAAAVVAVIVLGRPGTPATASPAHEPAPAATADRAPVVPAESDPIGAPIAELAIDPALDLAPVGEGPDHVAADES